MKRVATLLLLGGCRQVFGLDDPALFDAPVVDAPAAWLAPTLLFPPVNLTIDDPSATGDLREVYVVYAKDIYVVTRGDDPTSWGTPQLVSVSSTDDEASPEISADGLTLYFASTRAGTLGGFDIWKSTRVSRAGAWSMPTHEPKLSSPTDDLPGCTTADGSRISLASVGFGADFDLYEASQATPTMWGLPIVLSGVNSGQAERAACLSADGLTLYFDSARGSDRDLYVATRTSVDAAFEAPQFIAELNTQSFESAPWISPDGRDILFTSNRDGTNRAYQATKQ